MPPTSRWKRRSGSGAARSGAGTLVPHPAATSSAATRREATRPLNRSRLGDGPPLGTGDELGELGQRAGGVAGLGELPQLPAGRQLRVVDEQVDRAGSRVDDDAVTVVDEGDGAAVHRL